MILRTARAFCLKMDVLKVNKTKIWIPFRTEKSTDIKFIRANVVFLFVCFLIERLGPIYSSAKVCVAHRARQINTDMSREVYEGALEY